MYNGEKILDRLEELYEYLKNFPNGWYAPKNTSVYLKALTKNARSIKKKSNNRIKRVCIDRKGR